MVGPRQPRGGSAGSSSRGDDGLDTSRWTIARFLSALVPVTLARRAIAVSIDTDRDVYERDDSIEIAIDFKNRLPLPVDIPTPRQRRWGWSIDGQLEASDERLYVRDRPSSFSFGGGERKRIRFTWNGRLERTRGRHESVVPEPGEYEIRAFVATHEGRYQPADSTTIRIT
ncbi:hypothetical protein [Natrarchaeobius chitinivorans]|uniref:DUF7974 domain-containing protein n=1 Tax=Natrarchaeobius chitinivorans TaxID=1679083 RepID=A0A3N6PDJ3_NATCH|nr:hypothetical protein [Natrarchaeobius chitinivorans]RQG95095.1 hypothetical protein EA473_09080 [Natrarchaeobius chitinivorans]